MRYRMTCHDDGAVSIHIPPREAAALANLQRWRDRFDTTPWPEDDAQAVATFVEVAVDGHFEDTEEYVRSKGGDPTTPAPVADPAVKKADSDNSSSRPT